MESQSQTIFCTQCGAASVGEDSKFCAKCGTSLPSRGSPETAPGTGAPPDDHRKAGPQVRITKVAEFTSLSSYENWLRHSGSRVRVLSMSTTKRWSVWTGFLGGAKTYTVTYETDAPPDASSGGLVADFVIVALILGGLIFAAAVLNNTSGQGSVPTQAAANSRSAVRRHRHTVHRKRVEPRQDDTDQ
jgi:hypothetical protein